MTQVGFYILAQQTQKERFLFACKLVEKAQRLGHQVLLLVDTAQQAQELDCLLWEFRSDAFIPHCLLNEIDQHPKCQVHISTQAQIGEHHDILICLSQQLPPSISRFKRLLEIVIQADDVLHCSREHYKFLQHRGFPIQHHDMRT